MNDRFVDAFLRFGGAGTPGVLLSIILEIPIFLFSLTYGWLPINLFSSISILIGLFLIILFLVLSLWSLKALPFEKRGKALVKDGPYHYLRHPSYFAKIFLLLPGLSFIFRIWLPILTIPLLMVIWNNVVKEEEKILKKDFGHEFDQYCSETGKFFPRLKI